MSITKGNLEESDSERQAEESEEAPTRKAAEAANHPRTSCTIWADLIDETDQWAEADINNHQEKLRHKNLESKQTREKEGPMVPRTRTTTGTRTGIGWAIALFLKLLFAVARGEPETGL